MDFSWKKININLPLSKKWIVTIGNFDGVHLGHLSLIKELIGLAKKQQLNSALVSFTPHPKKVISNTRVYEIYNYEEKTAILKTLPLTSLFFINFNQKLAETSATDFISILTNKLPIHSFLVGYDFTFGKNREGNLELLNKICNNKKIQIQQIKPFFKEKEVISSSLIRKLLWEGNFSKANKYLGCQWQITGSIIAGKQLGRKLNFPTLNVNLNFDPPLQLGVYVVNVKVKDKWYAAIANYGYAPTLQKRKMPCLECHLLDFNDILVDGEITICPLKFLRAEMTFENLDDLKKQIQIDKDKAEQYFK